MPQTIDLLGFVTLGLLGGFGHCVGMCSPFVLFVSRRYAPADAGRAAVWRAHGWYTAGRVTTYAALGAGAGAIGGVVELAGGLLGVQRVAAGEQLPDSAQVVELRLGRFPAQDGDAVGQGEGLEHHLHDGARLQCVACDGPRREDLEVAVAPLGAVSSGPFGAVTRALQKRVPGHPLVIGLFLGLLPCGLLYSALIAAVARAGPVEGATALAAFGIGTAPALIGVSAADELLARHRAFVNRLSQVFLLAMGLWFLWSAVATFG